MGGIGVWGGKVQLQIICYAELRLIHDKLQQGAFGNSKEI